MSDCQVIQCKSGTRVNQQNAIETGPVDGDDLPAAINRQTARRTVRNRLERAAQRDRSADAEMYGVNASANYAVPTGRVSAGAVGVVDCLAQAAQAVA